MKPIRYSQWSHWADAFQGWRDARAGIPGQPQAGARPGPVTTPHREGLIRLAQDVFASEHLEYQRLVAGPHRRIMAEQARLETAKSALTWAQLAFDMEPAVPAGPELTRRRLGEERHPDTLVIQRRRKEHEKLRARAQAVVTRAQAEVTTIEADLAAAVQEAKQQHDAAIVRVERFHEYIHRRLAVYRRALVRFHPDGAWVNSVLSVRAPEIPGWALPDAYLPEHAHQPPEPPTNAPADEEEPHVRGTRIIVLRHDTTRFGSADPGEARPDVGYVKLESTDAAPWHFTIKKVAGRLELRTKAFDHGPYILGEAVRTATLDEGDWFDFAQHRYTMLDQDHLRDAPLGTPELVAVDLFAKSKSKVRLSGMSFVQRANTLLAVLGPSGAGKSSLFYALLGELPLEDGSRLFFHKMAMRTQSRQIREQVGFVPQDIELHKSLSVEATLRAGFRLRSPAPTTERDKRVTRALKDTGLEKQRHQSLSTLSGGQLRRVSIALELLTDPPLLMLDEPTSGLDANMDRQIMTLLRDHARKGHTVMVVTHATEHLGYADQLLTVVDDGAPVYSGPPQPIRRHFRCKSYADLMAELLAEPRKWADKYRLSGPAREARREADKLAQEIARQAAAAGARRRRSVAFRAGWRQLRVLVKRQCALLVTRGFSEKAARDRTGWAMVKNGVVVSLPLLVAAGAAALAALVAGRPGLGATPSLVGPTALTLLTTLCVLSGQALTYSDVVNELPIIRREFRAGVGALPVLTAKWLIYCVIAVAQAGVITAVFCLFPGLGPQRSVLYGPETDLFLGLAALSISAMSLGLLVSTLATKLEHAVAIITATSIAQIALNGVTSDLSHTSPISLLAGALPDRWGLAATASSIDLRGINQGHPTRVSADALWAHSSGQWLQDVAALALLSAGFFMLAACRLHVRLRPPKQQPAKQPPPSRPDPAGARG